jgi:hypothetical protein
VNQEKQVQFLEFDDFGYGEIVSLCAGRCNGNMRKASARLFPEIPVVIDVAVCDRCGREWDGRFE